MGQDGFTALHSAARNNSLEMAQVLLTSKAAVDVKSIVRAAWLHTVFSDSESAAVGLEQLGNTALHYAAANNCWQIASLLLATKATADVRNKVSAGHRWLMLCCDCCCGAD